MLRDVFYYGKKPNAHPRERHAKNLADARKQSTTSQFWVINEYCDYRNFDWDFDFEFLPDEDVWAENHNNVWPSRHQKDSGTWLCPKQRSDVIVYRADVDPLKRKNEVTHHWKVLENIDKSKWDFSWHPDPTDPPYIYRWGCKFFPVEFKTCLEYQVDGATEIKYMKEIVELLPNWDYIVENQKIDQDKFDLSWRPDPREPAYIYVWGNKWIDGKLKSTLEYHVPGASEKKYMPELLSVLPEWDKWVEHVAVDKLQFDFSWRPDPREPAFNYVWGNKYEEAELKPTLEYRMEGATQTKYMSEKVKVLPETERWKILENIDTSSFDFSWRPDPREPALIYVFGNELHDAVKMPTIEYHCPNSTEKKYVHDVKAKLASNAKLFEHLEDSYLKSYAWLPDPDSPPYIYAWGNQWNKPEDKISVQFVVLGATEYRYMEERATRKTCMDNWEVPKNVDVSNFDFSWEPSPADPPFIYQFGTQWQKTGGPRYIVEGATETKYVSTLTVKALPTKDNWTIPTNVDVSGFDFSWHPDATSPPYIYHFATQWALTGGPVYKVEGATEVKYVEHPSAIALHDKTNWFVPDDVDSDSFDFSWHPYVEDQPYVYQFGTQWQKTGGPKYVTPGVIPSSPTKYIDTRILKSRKLPNKKNFAILNNYKIKDFDWSWHPDDTEEPYIYVFGNNLYSAEIMPTIEYIVPGAKQIKYVNDIVATLDVDLTNWEVPDNIDVSNFDFTWKPNPKDPPYIYHFGTQWQKTGGPRYVLPDATEVKYIDTQIAKRLPVRKHFAILSNAVIENFDFSWHPDDTEEPYIYVFGNNQYPAEIMPTIEYTVPGAKQIKYVDVLIAKLGKDITNWEIPENVDVSSFDFSWKPNPKDPPYIYQFGTQWQKTGGPRYSIDGATEIKYVNAKVKALPTINNWHVLDNLIIEDFDYSWHPDDTEEPYVYVFGNNQYPAEIMPTIEYRMDGATQIKYVKDVVAKLGKDLTHWEIPNDIDVTDFDFSWKPNPKDPAYIYQFGTQWQKTGGPRYILPDANEVKYVTTFNAKALPTTKNWSLPKNIDVTDFDFSWHPDATSPPYIYHFATQWALTGGPIYTCEGATEVKYIEFPMAKALPCRDNWVIPDSVDSQLFDFSWHPYVEDQPYVYQFGTQWQKTGGPKYMTPGVQPGSPIKYIDTRILKATRLPRRKNFSILNNYKIKDFDWSWHPDDTEEPYIYVFGNNQYPGEIMPTIEYAVQGAKQIKYINDVVATLAPDKTNWEIPSNVDVSNFDFSWKPNPKDPPYIYQFGTQWQRSGGPRYVIEGATEIKYVTTQHAIAQPTKENWVIPDSLDISEFDFSWHPDSADKPYIYQFGTQWALTGGPRYVIPGATEIKYVEEPIAIAAPNKKNWIVPSNVDESSFDFSWHPYVEDQPYVYQFGTQWQKTGGPKYYAPGADETSFTKYIDTRILKATVKPSTKNWVIPEDVDVTDFDFSWHPDETDGKYIYQFGTTWSRVGGPQYVVEGATQIKFVDTIKAKIKGDKTKWKIPNDIDMSSFDFSWQPDVDDKPYIYQFGTQWQKTGGPKYIVPDAIEVKYINVLKAKKLPSKTNNWKINIPIVNFDYSWHPDETEEPYIYVFGNQWNRAEIESTVEYHVEGATKIKYINDIIAEVAPNKTNWIINHEVDSFDFSWRPDPTEPAYVYVFGNTQYPGTIMPTLSYVKPGALQKKYIDTIVARLAFKPELYENTKLISEFDYSWRPNPKDPPYIYQFGTQWAKTHGPRYIVEGATEVKYVSDRVAKILPDMTHWEVPEGFDLNTFDFSWHPDATVPAYVYKFGTVLEDINLEDGPKYITPNHNNHVVHMNIDVAKLQNIEYSKYYIETSLENLIKEHSNEIFWALRKNIDYTNFDFNWRPTKENVFHINIFGSPESELTQTYFINAKMYNLGYTDKNYLEQDKKVDDLNLAKLFKKLDIFVVDKGNPEAQTRFEQLKARFGNVQKTRYLNTWVDTINRCINRSTTDLCWILNSELDYSDFDFEFYPNPWQMKMIHVFGTQWSHWGTTFVVNKETFANDTKYVKIIEHLNNLNFVKDKKAVATNNLYDMFVIDHGNPEMENVMHILQSRASGKTVTTVKAEQTYLNTFKKIVGSLPEKKDHYIWICSSVCDYRGFDFSYICDPFAKDNLHVFPSEKQKFGDTFLVDVNKLRLVISDMEIMEDYGKINYNQHQRVPRLPAPVFVTYEDTHFKNALQQFKFPYAIFVTQDCTQQQLVDEEPMSLWTPERKNIAITSVGGTRIIVPDEVKNYVKRELYDYPYIKTNSRLAKSNPMDIVFLSNGESCAEENYQHLLEVTKGLPNRVVRVDGVNGRVAAYHAAAEASNTPWMFTVFAKLKVSNKFDWNWQPDRLQVPKHYIFHAKNPVNGLIYGHQAMIAYNKKLTLNNNGSKGLDFTQDDEHEVVELLSGTAMYNTDAWSTWRTSFREVIKLQKDKSKIGKERLHSWLNKAEGDFADYSINGAKDAVEYYKKVKGNINKLKLSYEWEWLKKYFEAKYK